MKARTATILPLLFLLGCREEASAPTSASSAPPPAHPAMKEAPTGQPAPAAGHDHGAEGLPAGHPPVTGAGPKPAAPPPARSDAAPAAAASGGLVAKLQTVGLSAKVPLGWVEEPGARPMRLATVRLPKAGGDTEDGEMSVSQAFGGLEANIERWRGQFQERPEPVLAKKQPSGLEVTTVEMEGTFVDSMRSGGPKPGTKLLGAVVKAAGGESLIFFKAWGPKATMESWKPSFEEFVTSLQSAK